MRYSHGLLALCAAISASSCASIHGADPVIASDGIYDDSHRVAPHPDRDGTVYTLPQTPDAKAFIDLFNTSAQDPANKQKAKDMLVAGLSLVRGNCGFYFTSTGNTQKWIFVAQDTVGAAGTLATGVMGALGAGTPSIAWVGLATGTAYSGINIYTKNFLFASENIDSVRTAVLKQLDQDRATLLKNWDASVAPANSAPEDFSYYAAKQTVLDEQNICTDAHILTIVHAALEASNPPASPGVTPTVSKLAP